MRFDIRLLKQALASRTALSLTIGFGFANGILIILQAAGLAHIIDRVFLKAQSLVDVCLWLVWLLIVMFARAGLVWLGEISAHSVAAQAKNTLRERLFKHIYALGPVYASGEQTGELTQVLVDGIEALDAYFSQYLPQLALAALIPAAILFFVVPVDLTSGIVLLVTAPLIPIFMVLIGNVADHLTRKQWQSLSRMSAYLLDVLQGLATLKILGRSREQIRSVALVSDRFREATMRVLRVTFLSALVLELVSTLSTALVAVEIGLRLLYGRMAFEPALFVLILAPEFYLPLRMLGARFHAGMEGAAAAERIFAILETDTVLPMEPKSSSAVHGFHRDASIFFENVSYTYPGGLNALQDISFELQAGQRTALVGPSGAGKSTLAALLLRFASPAQGQIQIGNTPLDTIPVDEWRRNVAWVPQTPHLFQGTVLENLLLGKPEATREEAIAAAGQAGADGWIRALPDGYDTWIGEGGKTLSGGQAQWLAAARAFLKDAPILILDEATSYLDPESEEIFQEALGRLQKGRTTLVIAHRLNTVYRSDQILVLSEGRLVQMGRHQALVEQPGVYRSLVAAQGRGYATGD